jgi:signal transduction histidine kinase
LIEDINNQIELINGLSDLARANADFPNTKLQNISSIELIIEAIEELKKNKPDFLINFKLNEIPDEEDLLSIKGNNALLKSAIINLMDNACKFSDKHSCDVSLSFVDNLVRFNIDDNGIGISEDDLKHIFEPFYRSNNTRKISGHGIGLSLVNKIIQLHQGQIKVESKLDVGTKIIVDFPANLASLI